MSAPLAALVALAYDAILVRDPDDRIVFWNEGAAALYGWSETEAVGRVSHELLATAFPRPLAEIERELAECGRWEGRLRQRTKGGGEIVADSRWAAQQSPDGDRVAVLEVNRDVSARAAAERELAADAERFRSIFDASLDAILLTAPDGRIFAANAAAQEMFGRTEAEIVAGGRELLVDSSDPRLAAALRRRAETGRFRADVRALHSDGTAFEVAVSSVVFVDAAGETRTSMVIRDITERIGALERLRESEARFRALADAAFEGIFIHDGERIVDMNRAACALFDSSEEGLRGRRILDFVPREEQGRIGAILSTGAESYETPAVTVTGRRLLAEVSRRSITLAGKPARVVAIRDITERERARQALEEQNERLRELDALKSEFVALVSHELRTPLTSIIAHLDLLEAGETGPLDGKRQRYVEVAARNARRLRRLVDDLLLIARADAGRFPLQRSRFDLALVVEEVAEALRPAAAEAGVDVVVRHAASPALDADRDRIAQLLDNLAWNALDATPRGGSVELAVEAADGYATLVVSDTGRGIEAREQPHIFDRFYRTKNAVAGVGLGLAIVKEIVDAHDGTVAVESRPGRGTTFTVRLPRAR